MEEYMLTNAIQKQSMQHQDCYMRNFSVLLIPFLFLQKD